MGGSDAPENLVEVTVTQHTMFHFCNYQLWGNEEDKLAWKGLSGQINVDEIILERQVVGGKKGGKIGGRTSYENGTGIFKMTPREKSEASRKGGKKGGKIGGRTTYENGIGIHRMSSEEKSIACRKGGKIVGKRHKENGTGFFKLTPEQRSEIGKKSIKITNAQRWQCTVTGYVSTPAGLTRYQTVRGIDTSNRIRIQ
jgi:hypothetical protein